VQFEDVLGRPVVVVAQRLDEQAVLGADDPLAPAGCQPGEGAPVVLRGVPQADDDGRQFLGPVMPVCRPVQAAVEHQEPLHVVGALDLLLKSHQLVDVGLGQVRGRLGEQQGLQPPRIL
jgi:hypothetical protein